MSSGRDYNRIVYAKNGIDARKAYDELVAKWTPLAPVPSIYSSARIPRVSKLLISGLFQKVRVLAQDGVRRSFSTEVETHPESLDSNSPLSCSGMSRK